MTLRNEEKLGRLIHVAMIFTGTWVNLFLRKNPSGHYIWHTELDDNEEETPIRGTTIEAAIFMGARHWKEKEFKSLGCGYRYTLPERDEHGINALFYQMAASLNSSNGIYYDEEICNNCFVQNTSDQAYRMWKNLQMPCK